jgi:hypothetical protein
MVQKEVQLQCPVAASATVTAEPRPCPRAGVTWAPASAGVTFGAKRAHFNLRHPREGGDPGHREAERPVWKELDAPGPAS